VENSWGDKVGNKGYFVMSDDWMNEYTYQVVVHKKYLSDELRQAWDQEPIVLKPWDPMGSLAIMK
jgi:bleomycin hydrolase